MSQHKQMKAVSPLLQQVINISSIVGGVGTLIFCIWAYQAGVLQSKETLSAFIQQAGLWGPPLFIFMMIWPVSPADFLCMLAALTKMTFKRYMIIIVLTKPFTLVVYTYGLTYIIDFFWQMF